LCFVTFFFLLFILRMWNQKLFFRFRTGKFPSAAPTVVGANGITMVMMFVGGVVSGLTVLSVLFLP